MSNDRPQNYCKKPGRKRKPIVTKQQREFARVYVETNDKEYAKEVAGYSKATEPTQSARVLACIDDYRKIMENEFKSRAYQMMLGMEELANTARSEHVKYLATKDMLDRAGLAPVNKSEIETTKVISSESRITRELIDRVNKLKEGK